MREQSAHMARTHDAKDPKSKGHVAAGFSAPWHSRLNANLEAIWAWQKAGKSLRDIVGLLASEKGETVALSTLHTFVRSRKRRFAELAALPELPGHRVPTPAAGQKAPEDAPGKAAAALPADTPAPAVKPRTFDPQTDNSGFPLSAHSEVVGRDTAGRPLTRNRPYRGQV